MVVRHLQSSVYSLSEQQWLVSIGLSVMHLLQNHGSKLAKINWGNNSYIVEHIRSLGRIKHHVSFGVSHFKY